MKITIKRKMYSVIRIALKSIKPWFPMKSQGWFNITDIKVYRKITGTYTLEERMENYRKFKETIERLAPRYIPCPENPDSDSIECYRAWDDCEDWGDE